MRIKQAHKVILPIAFALAAGYVVCRAVNTTLSNASRLGHSGQSQSQNQQQKSQQQFPQPSPAAAVTQIIHQSWKTKQLPTKRAERWSATWKTCYPTWEWKLWTDEDNLALVRNHYSWFLPVYQAQAWPVQKADLVRYMYLHRYGGIYADLDTVCLRNFTHLLASNSLTFGGMEDDHDDGSLHSLVQNSFMAARSPGHEFWLRLLRRIERNFKSGKKGRPEDLTGPNVMMDELREYLKSNATDVTVYPGRYFNPFSWKMNKHSAVCKDFGRMSDQDERACVDKFPNAYVVQMHAQSWGKGRM